jgi:transcriptional regulator with XRE-family HTH domain
LTPLRRTISRNIAEVRGARGMSQAELAVRCGISPQAVCRMERGIMGMTARTLVNVADVLNVSTDYLLGRINGLDKEIENGKVASK